MDCRSIVALLVDMAVTRVRLVVRTVRSVVRRRDYSNV